ncbi:DUF927 domain-containing protein [Proteiniclasticum sp.]|uniref:DUF927 domain-containing protein n=1 Tax=Proteiniclasticum sp. TaxID=2053595 RepID=UPI0025DFB424|nr:DUF927 domain-containing protein [Proteiniclasticum sp.]
MKPVFRESQSTQYHREFYTTDEKVMQRCSRDTVRSVSDYIKISSIEHNIDSNDYLGNITYKAFGELKTLTVPRSTYLQRRRLLDLQNQGLDVTEENATLLVKYFKEEEECLVGAIRATHNTLGFSTHNGKLIFKHYNAIGIESTYSGPYDVRPRGSDKDYLKMIKEEVLGNPLMEFILVSGLSSVILAYLSDEYSLDSLIIHIASDSTTGKSTALKLAASLWSVTDVKADSLFSSYNGTNQALINKICGFSGIPYCLDEISMSSMQNFTSFIYTLVNGVEKERLTKDSKLMEKKSWLVTLLSNGERSLVGLASKNKCIAARVFEIKNVTFTRDAENAENIQRAIQKNYGLLGPKYAEYIMTLKKEDICKRFEEVRENFSALVKTTQATDELFERRTLKFAVLLLTAEYFEKFSRFTLNKDAITELLMSIEAESTGTRNNHANAMDYIKDYITINAAAFGLGGNGHNLNYGTVTPKRDYTEVVVYKPSFNEMLRKGNYEDSSIVLRELKSNGYLDCDADRYTRSRKNHNGIRQDVYVLKLYNYPIQEVITDSPTEGDEKHE